MSVIKIFISHSHQDEVLARLLVRVLTESLDVPNGAIRCTSVPGYKIPMGERISQSIIEEVKSTEFFILIASPFSLNSDWVLFELANSNAAGFGGLEGIFMPFFAGNFNENDLPVPLKNNISCRQLSDPEAIMELIEVIKDKMKWSVKDEAKGRQAIQELSLTANKYSNWNKAPDQPVLKFAWKRDQTGEGWHLQNIGTGKAQRIKLFRGDDLAYLQEFNDYNYLDIPSGVSIFLPRLDGNDLAAKYSDEQGRIYDVKCTACWNTITLKTDP